MDEPQPTTSSVPDEPPQPPKFPKQPMLAADGIHNGKPRKVDIKLEFPIKSPVLIEKPKTITQLFAKQATKTSSNNAPDVTVCHLVYDRKDRLQSQEKVIQQQTTPPASPIRAGESQEKPQTPPASPIIIMPALSPILPAVPFESHIQTPPILSPSLEDKTSSSDEPKYLDISDGEVSFLITPKRKALMLMNKTLTEQPIVDKKEECFNSSDSEVIFNVKETAAKKADEKVDEIKAFFDKQNAEKNEEDLKETFKEEIKQEAKEDFKEEESKEDLKEEESKENLKEEESKTDNDNLAEQDKENVISAKEEEASLKDLSDLAKKFIQDEDNQLILDILADLNSHTMVLLGNDRLSDSVASEYLRKRKAAAISLQQHHPTKKVARVLLKDLKDQEYGFACHLCPTKLQNIGSFRKHLAFVHFKERILKEYPPEIHPNGEYQCLFENCGAKIKEERNYLCHLASMHKVGRKYMAQMGMMNSSINWSPEQIWPL